MRIERLEHPGEERLAARLCGQPGGVWLDAHGSQGPDARWSYLAAAPVEVRRAALADPAPLRLLDGLGGARAKSRAGPSPGPDPGALPRWIGYVGYDAALGADPRTPPRLARDRDAPVLWLGRYDAVVAVDHARGEAFLCGEDAQACERLRERLRPGAAAAPSARIGAPHVPAAREHESAIRAALEHIVAGDVYQVNLARRWEAAFAGDALALFLAMRRASPVPFGFYLDAGDHALCGRSMETFLRWGGGGGELSTRPIKGTIARGGDDPSEQRALRADDKERAEHSMIVDLMRNDLGRVALAGTVRVSERMAVEPYARLHHLVSTVTCRPREGTSLREIFEATFPPGSVTGAPKSSAVRLIEALEPVPRGAYTGCVGYVDRAGGCLFAVAIRTAQVAGGRARYHAGGGIVSASDPLREVEETELKARAFLDAVAALRERDEAR